MTDTYKIRQIGGCLMVTIPQHASRVLQLKAGDEVKIVVSGKQGWVRLEPAKKPKRKTR